MRPSTAAVASMRGEKQRRGVIELMQQNRTQIEPWLNPSPPIYLVLAPLRPCEIDKMYGGRCAELRSLNSACFFVFFCTLEEHQRRVNNQEPLPFSFVAISTIIRRRIWLQVLLAEAAACFINYPGPCRGINATLARRKTKNTAPSFTLQGEVLISL